MSILTFAFPEMICLSEMSHEFPWRKFDFVVHNVIYKIIRYCLNNVIQFSGNANYSMNHKVELIPEEFEHMLNTKKLSQRENLSQDCFETSCFYWVYPGVYFIICHRVYF